MQQDSLPPRGSHPTSPEPLSGGPMVIFILFWMFWGVMWGLLIGYLVWG